MRLAAYSFAAGPDMEQNLAAIRRGAQQASQAGARLLALPECALCGYPPVETPRAASIRPEDLEKGFAALASLAREQALYLFAGSVRYSQGLRYNSTLLFGPDGSLLARTTSAPSGAGTWTTSPGASSPAFSTWTACASGRGSALRCASPSAFGSSTWPRRSFAS